MRIYLGSCSNPDLRKARQTAPSHVYGHCWTPQNRGFEHVPFFVDNGEYAAAQNGDEWDSDEWLGLLDRLSQYAYKPDFIVLPDAYNSAEGTIERHREWVPEVLDRGLDPAFVLQPGLDEKMQISLADRLGAKFVFVGGETRWKRAMGSTIVSEAHDRGLKVHIGNPDGEEGLPWAYKIGADSADTSTVCQNQYWHYLERLEEVTLSRGSLKKDNHQSRLGEVSL